MEHDYALRPAVDAILKAVSHMIEESARINHTGKTFEMIENEARMKLYDALDLIAAEGRMP